MDDQLEQLLEKERKLTFLFGEKIYELYKDHAIRFFYSTAGEDQEPEVEKLVKLMDYISDRIDRIEDAYDEEEVQAAEAESEGAPVLQEPVKKQAPVEEEIEEIEEIEEAPQEEAVQEQEEILADEGFPLAEDKAEVLETPVQVEDVLEPIEEPVVFGKAQDSFAEDEIEKALVQEEMISAPVLREKVLDEETIKDIIATGSFPSSADKRLFEKNLKQFCKSDERDRAISIGQIAHIAGIETVHRVYGYAMKDPSALVRLAVVKSISRMKDNDGEGIFELGLNDPDEKIRITAIKGLGSHVSERHGEILEALLNDANEHVRGLAVTYLGIYYGKEGVAKAVKAWTDESPYVRASLVDMLAIVKPDGALTTIKHLLSDRDENVKKEAEKALEKLLPHREKEGKYGKRKN